MSDTSENSDNEPLINLTRKRKSFGRVKDAAKKIRNHTYETGPSCECLRLKCFSRLTQEQQHDIINRFNTMSDRNEQNNYLCGLISMRDIKQRRPRKEENEAYLRDHSYSYKVRIANAEKGSYEDVEVCQKAFINLHGITNRRIMTMKQYLKTKGNSCLDRRGKHDTRPRKIDDQTLQYVHQHIKSFKGRKSHYSSKNTRRLYLPETLNIKQMHKLYLDKQFPGKRVSYETYRNIFLKDFNIRFGYPRSDTCSMCDGTKVKKDALKLQLRNTAQDFARVAELQKQLKKLEIEDKLHKLKAQTFYKKKRQEKKLSRKRTDYEAITMDFSKNLPTPNITTNDVYCKRQLTFISFNIHVLATNQSVFYTYPQTIAKKGADDVMSLLYHFCTEALKPEVQHLRIFCDSCAGQNKNFTLVRFLHYMVHAKKRFQTVSVAFPVRGHSYLGSDKDFGLTKQKSVVEIPDQWVNVFKEARVEPAPFDVFACTQEMFYAWTKFLSPFFRKTCPFPTRPVKEIKFSINHPRTVAVREEAYNAAPTHFVITGRNSKLPGDVHPQHSYTQLIPIPKKKYEQLQDLKKFVAEEHQSYYEQLPWVNAIQSDDEMDMI